MNNKGFAITGIIYTLFILFLMILLAILSISSSYQRMIIKSVESLEPSFEGKKVGNITDSYYEYDNFGIIRIKANYTGKYIYKVDENYDSVINDADNLLCTVFLTKETDITDDLTGLRSLSFSPYICENYKINNEMFELVTVYNFEEVS